MSGSYYALNAKYNSLLSLINSGGGGGGIDVVDAFGPDIIGRTDGTDGTDGTGGIGIPELC